MCSRSIKPQLGEEVWVFNKTFQISKSTKLNQSRTKIGNRSLTLERRMRWTGAPGSTLMLAGPHG